MANPKDGTRHGNHVKFSDSDPDLNVKLDDMRNAGMLITNKWKELWFTAIQYAWGQHLQGWKLKKDWEYIVINRIYPLMFQTIAKLAGNHPKILAHPWDEEQEGASEFADRWAGHLQYLWESPYELNMRLKLIKGLLDAGIFGYMVSKVYWEEKPKNGWDNKSKKYIGKIEQRFIHPGTFWTDPSAEIVDEAENLGTKRRVKLEWAINRWPKHEKEFVNSSYTSSDPQWTAGDMISYKNQKGNSLSLSRQRRFSRIVSLILNTGAASGDTLPDGGIGTGDIQRYVDIEEIYWRDYEEKDVKIEDIVPPKDLIAQGKIEIEELTGLYIDTQTSKPVPTGDWEKVVTAEYKEPLYPNGRFVFRVNRTILNPKEEDQVYTEKKWPFNVMPYHILPHMWQGNNAIELSRHNNDMLNITVSSMVQRVRRGADPVKVVEAGALARGKDGKVRSTHNDITGLGRIVVAARGKVDKMRDWLNVPLSPEEVAVAQFLKQDIDDQMFMQDVARGAAQKGQQTKAEIVRLNANSLDYTQLQGVFLDKFIDDLASNMAELAQNNYDVGRLLKIIADGLQSAGKLTQNQLDVMFDVNIEPGSTLPFDEVKKQQEYGAAYKLLESPIPNPMIEDMLRILNISKRKEILSRYQGLQLFRQFIAIGAQLAQSSEDPEVQQMMVQLSEIPGMQEVTKLLLQAGQLAGQVQV